MGGGGGGSTWWSAGLGFFPAKVGETMKKLNFLTQLQKNLYWPIRKYLLLFGLAILNINLVFSMIKAVFIFESIYSSLLVISGTTRFTFE